jgi:hypothetical protein
MFALMFYEQNCPTMIDTPREPTAKGIVVYIAGPYTGDGAEETKQRNTERAERLADKIQDLGYDPLIPHQNHYRHQRCPRPYREWLEHVKHLAQRCDVILRDTIELPGDSPGADEEEELGRPVVYSVEELQERFPVATARRK